MCGVAAIDGSGVLEQSLKLAGDMFAAAHLLFALAEKEKQRICIDKSPHFRGWARLEGGDEVLELGPEEPAQAKGGTNDADIVLAFQGVKASSCEEAKPSTGCAAGAPRQSGPPTGSGRYGNPWVSRERSTLHGHGAQSNSILTMSWCALKQPSTQATQQAPSSSNPASTHSSTQVSSNPAHSSARSSVQLQVS